MSGTATVKGGGKVKSGGGSSGKKTQKALNKASKGFSSTNIMKSPTDKPVKGKFNVYNFKPTKGEVFKLPYLAQAVVLTGKADAKVVGHSGPNVELIVTDQGHDTVNAAGGIGTIIGNGPDTISTNSPGKAGGNLLIQTSHPSVINMYGASVTVQGNGDTVNVLSGTNNLVAQGGEVVHVGAGLSASLNLTDHGQTEKVTLGGNDTVTVTGGKDSITGTGTNQIKLAGGATDTIHGNVQVTITDGASYNLSVSGHDTLSFGSGQDTIVLHGAASVKGSAGDVLFRDFKGTASVAAGSGDSTLIGGAGNDTFTGSAGLVSMQGGKGANVFQGGTGHDTMVAGGTSNLFSFYEGKSGGTHVIHGFKNGPDHLNLVGYDTAAALAGAHVVGGNTVISLDSGHTTITLVGFTHLTAASFGT
ncbi:MAG TPA: hypothetical protein VGS12_00765 [Caulobacteraceae bacterium]|nr:hypothetical protein [Caulobacteraceae bacterium]